MRRYFGLLKKISYKRIRAFTLAFILFSMLLLSACNGILRIRETKNYANDLPQPNPGDGINYKSSVDLYYRFCNTSYLVPLTVDINFSSNEKPEAAILRALLSGMGTSSIYTTAIPEEVELISMMESGDTLFVTLNAAFADDSLYATNETKKIAVCEILNTLSAHGNSSVQILVDKSGNGIGERVTYEELGFDAKYDENTDYAAPFAFTKSIVITPTAILDYAVSCIQRGEYDKAALLFVSNTKKRNVTGDDIKRFSDKYDITECEITHTGAVTAIAEVYCTMKFRALKTNKDIVFDGKLLLSKYESFYKIQYENFTECAGGLD